MMADVAANTDDARLVFVNQGEGAEVIQRYLTAKNLKLDHVILDALAEFGRRYEVPGLPATFFIGSDGTPRSVHMGEISREGLLEDVSRIQPEEVTSRASERKDWADRRQPVALWEGDVRRDETTTNYR